MQVVLYRDWLYNNKYNESTDLADCLCCSPMPEW